MKLTRRQLRNLINEAMKGYLPPEYEDEYFDDIRKGPGALDAAQEIYKNSHLETDHHTFLPNF